MGGVNTLVLLLINGGLIALLVNTGERVITAERERARLRHEHREMMKMVDELRAQVRHLEAF